MQKFKAGDQVYCPRLSTSYFTLSKPYDNELLILYFDDDEYGFTEDGKYSSIDIIPSIYHANDNNKDILEKLYNLTFQQASVTLSYKIPKPFIPNIGEDYWFISIAASNGKYQCHTNGGDKLDLELIKFGVYRSEKDVEQVYNNHQAAISKLI